jgi:multicomponent Na+:H+ antiporter subunit D
MVYMVLVFASAGVFHHSGIKIPFFAFFSHDSGIRVKEAPWNMLLAMGATAVLCVAIGCFPGALYNILPYEMDYQPYTPSHVMTQLQLLFFSGLAFAVLKRTGLYPPELAAENLDTDWVYRRMLPRAYGGLVNVAASIRERLVGTSLRGLERLAGQIYRYHGPGGVLSRTWPTGTTVLWVAIILGAFLLAYFI